jgi:hypothetical protein
MKRSNLLAFVFATAGTLLILCSLTLTAVSGHQNTRREAGPQPTTAAKQVALPSTLSGIVADGSGPVAGAIVQLQGTPNKTLTDETGAFTLTNITSTTPVVVTGWSAGHYVGWATVDPAAPGWKGGKDIQITIRPLPQKDNSQYGWFSFEGVNGSAACGLCHREYTEWQADAHAHAATNPHFLNVYTGTDVNGNPGQPVQFGYSTVPQPPDPNKPYYGPGFRLDNPSRAGNCATCHTPVASKSPNTMNCAWSGCHTDLTIERAAGRIDRPALPVNLTGNAAEGISCEFCHKIGSVILDPKTGMPLPDMPGILSYQLHRPEHESDQVFFGTVVDVSRPDSYLPLLSKSEFCAGCHFGVMGGVVGMGEVTGGTVIYNSYGEWKDSPYSNPDTGKTCQDCHMPVSAANWMVKAERGGITRDYAPMHLHTMPGAGDKNLLQNAVTMTSSAQVSGGLLQVQVSITNDKTGHDVPTDAPMRSVMLVVQARDASGNPLPLQEGSVNPDFAGDYAGVPGKTFAKVLKDDWTGETPTSAFWRPVTIVEDNRIQALATDTSRYTFRAPPGTAVTVNVQLIYRRSFYVLMQQKGWTDPDILMEHETIQVPGT